MPASVFGGSPCRVGHVVFPYNLLNHFFGKLPNHFGKLPFGKADKLFFLFGGRRISLTCNSHWEPHYGGITTSRLFDPAADIFALGNALKPIWALHYEHRLVFSHKASLWEQHGTSIAHRKKRTGSRQFLGSLFRGPGRMPGSPHGAFCK